MISSTVMAIDTLRYKKVLGHFPTGVAVVTTMSATGNPVGMTISSFCSVSLNPPLVLFCLGRDAECFEEFATSTNFAVCFLGDDAHHLSDRFAQIGGDKWHKTAFEIWPAGCPVLSEAVAAVECRRANILEAGDHLIVIGEVIGLAEKAGDTGPLVHHRGSYRRLAAPEADGA